MRIRRLALLVCLLALVTGTARLSAWGGQGHRLVGLVAAAHLTTIAKSNVRWLLGPETLADVASWADDYRGGVAQTGPWHYVDMPATATSYDRDRDCPTQPGVMPGARNDIWRDCIVDRLRYNEERLADAKLD